MPVARKRSSRRRDLWEHIMEGRAFVLDLLTNPSKTWTISLVLLLLEVVLNVFVVHYVKYTEIDWIAYMQEVEGFLNGTRNYMELKGDTGPLVYPAGFVYLYSLLYYVTSHGENIKVAQYIFCLFYLLNLCLVARIYDKTRVCPPYVLIFMTCTSYRIHSIFVLRLFNDPVAMAILYGAVNLFISRKWTIGCVLFSLAVSVKMNILLFAPALLVILLSETGIMKTVANLLICLAIQIGLALPFLIENAHGYIARSFDLGRQFFYVWTVNWRLIPEELFLNKTFQMSLLACHLALLLAFAIFKWSDSFVNLISLIDPRKNWKACKSEISTQKIVVMLFTSNFIGICFSRSLHYQFYVWYYHSLPYLLWHIKVTPIIRLLLLGLIELSWNTYPSTTTSSLTLHVVHLLMLLGLWFIPVQDRPEKEKFQ